MIDFGHQVWSLQENRFAKTLALSTGEERTSGSLKRTGTVDKFRLKTLITTLQKFLQPRCCVKIELQTDLELFDFASTRMVLRWLLASHKR